MSLSARRAWIEILASRLSDMSNASLSARRAWIEIANFCKNRFCPTVALRKESVDRNALLMALNLPSRRVALRKESVDRNSVQPRKTEVPGASLSARRAWIEIDTLTDDVSTGGVALRKESVDRN